MDAPSDLLTVSRAEFIVEGKTWQQTGKAQRYKQEDGWSPCTHTEEAKRKQCPSVSLESQQPISSSKALSPKGAIIFPQVLSIKPCEPMRDIHAQPTIATTAKQGTEAGQIRTSTCLWRLLSEVKSQHFTLS